MVKSVARSGDRFTPYKIKRGSRPMNLPTSKIKTSARRGSLYAYPREKSINHFKEQIRRLTRRCAPVTRFPGTVSGTCGIGSRSPWPPPFAPPPPQPITQLCSAASQLLWQSLTSPNRASVATAPRLPTADRQPSGAFGRPGDLPVPLTRRLAGSHHRLAGRANSLGVARDLLCLEHLNRTCAPAGWPQRMPSRKSRL